MLYNEKNNTIKPAALWKNIFFVVDIFVRSAEQFNWVATSLQGYFVGVWYVAHVFDVVDFKVSGLRMCVKHLEKLKLVSLVNINKYLVFRFEFWWLRF